MEVIAGIKEISKPSAVLLREQLPWKEIANWTHKGSSSYTDLWMDQINGATRGSFHRFAHHHPYDFFKASLHDPNLSYSDYFSHFGKDIITIRGIPIVPESITNIMIDAGISKSIVYSWTQLNIFDITFGTLSLVDSSKDFVLAITGHLAWGTQTIMLTFVKGTGYIIGGIWTANPLLIASGILDWGAGIASYLHHISTPAPIISQHIINGFLGGLGSGVIVSALRLGLSWKTTNVQEKLQIVGESLSLSVILGTLSSVSLWLSIPLGIAYSIARMMVKKHNQNDEEISMWNPAGEKYLLNYIENEFGDETREEMLALLKKLKKEFEPLDFIKEEFGNEAKERMAEFLNRINKKIEFS